MHEVKGEQAGAAHGDRSLAEQVFQEYVEHRQHEHAEQGAHEPPAKGGHAEQPDAGGDDELAQGWVGHLVGIDIVQVLQSGAGVVDLIKVGRVHVGGLVRPYVRLVKQSLPPGGHVLGDQGLPLVPQGQLRQPEALVSLYRTCGNPPQAGGDRAVGLLLILSGLGQVHYLPLQQGVIGLVQRDPLPAFPVVRGVFQPIIARTQGGVVGDLVHRYRLAEGEGEGGVVLENGVSLGHVEVTQAEEGGGGIDQRDHQHGQHVPSPEGMALQGEGHLPGPGPGLRHGDPLQGVGPGFETVPVVEEKGQTDGQGHQHPDSGGGQIAKEPGQAIGDSVPHGRQPSTLGRGGGRRQGKAGQR